MQHEHDMKLAYDYDNGGDGPMYCTPRLPIFGHATDGMERMLSDLYFQWNNPMVYVIEWDGDCGKWKQTFPCEQPNVVPAAANEALGVYRRECRMADLFKKCTAAFHGAFLAKKPIKLAALFASTHLTDAEKNALKPHILAYNERIHNERMAAKKRDDERRARDEKRRKHNVTTLGEIFNFSQLQK